MIHGMSRKEFSDAIYRHLDAYMRTEKDILKPFQRERIINGVLGDLDTSDPTHDGLSGYIESPMGTGKTIMMGAVVKALEPLRRQLAEKTEAQTLILAPTVLLCEQIKQDLVDPVGIAADDIGIYDSTDTAFNKEDQLSKPIVVMTFSAIRSLYKRHSEAGEADWIKNFPFVQIDEVDLAKGEETEPVIRALLDNSYVFGWTATGKSFYKGKDTSIGNIYFNGRNPAHRTTVAQAIRNKENAPTRNLIFELQTDVKISSAKGEDFSESDLNRITAFEGRDDAAIAIIDQHIDGKTGKRLKDMKQVWFCNGINHAETVARKLNERYGPGYAIAVSSKTPKDDVRDENGNIKQMGLQRILQLHREGKIPVVTNADILTRGFDSPGTHLVVNLVPTRSYARAAQRGRSTRLDPKDPNKIAFVVDFFDTGIHDAVAFTDILGSSYVTQEPEAVENAPRKEGRSGPASAPIPGADNTTAAGIHFRLIDALELNERKKPPSDLDPDGSMLPARDMARLVGGRQARVYALYAEILAEERKVRALENLEDIEFIILRRKEGVLRIPREDLAIKSYKGEDILYIHQKHFDSLKRILKPYPVLAKDSSLFARYKMAAEVGTAPNNLEAIYEAIAKAWHNAPDNADSISIPWNGQTLTFASSDIGMFQSGARTEFFIDRRYAGALRQALEVASLRPDETYLPSAQMAAHLHVDRKAVNTLFDTIKAAYQDKSRAAEDTLSVSVNDQSLHLARAEMGIYRTTKGGKDAFLISTRLEPELRKIFPVKVAPPPRSPIAKAPDGWLHMNGLATEMYITTKTFKPLYDALRQAYETTPEGNPDVVVNYEGRVVSLPRHQMGLYPAGRHTSLFIDPSCLPMLNDGLGLKPTAPKNFLSAAECASKIAKAERDVKSIFSAFEAAYRAGKPEADIVGIRWNHRDFALPREDMGEFRRGGQTTFFIHSKHQDHIGLFLDRAREAKAQTLKAHTDTPDPGKKR